jgi:hypothetical protein
MTVINMAAGNGIDNFSFWKLNNRWRQEILKQFFETLKHFDLKSKELILSHRP